MKNKYYPLLIAIVIIGLFFTEIEFVYFNSKKISPALQAEKVILPDSLAEQLGQNFIVGIDGKVLSDNERKILEKIKPAGIILYYRNYENPSQLKDLISQLQSLAAETTKHPYFIMIDEEPAGAARLDLFNNVFAFGVPDWKQIEKGIKIMNGLGINVDLAPIADFAFDDSTFIKDRIPAHDINNLKDFNKKFIALLNQNHILATLKHFPGMGVFVDDPHEKLPYANPDISVMDRSIDIFRDGINSGADFVMTCHGVYDDIDPDNPATLSKKITTDILRKEVGFNGLAITDDLSEMPFITGKKIDLSEAAEQSFIAGHNLVMFSHKLEITEKIFDKLLNAVGGNEGLKSIIAQNYIKVILLKNKKL